MDDKNQGEPAKTRSSGKRPSKQMYNFGSIDEGVQCLTRYTQVDDFQVFAGVGTRICATERCIIHNQWTDSLTFTSVNMYHVSSSATPFHRGVIRF